MSKVAQDYYNSDDADAFYASIWGGEDIHIGLYEREDEAIIDASRKTVERIEKIIASEKQILGWHKLRTRSLGREIFVDLHVLVDPNLTVTEAHDISDCLEQSLHEKINQPVNVVVHVEPKLY